MDKKIKLNLGCEDKILKGFINVDFNKKNGIKVLDLDKRPLPWKNNTVDYILASHIIEHLEDPLSFMLELHRISKKGGIIDVFVPHFSLFASHADLTHKKHFSYFTFGEKWVNKQLFNLFNVKKRLNFTRANYKWLNIIFNPLINASPKIYERLFCHILPCSEIHFRMEVIK